MPGVTGVRVNGCSCLLTDGPIEAVFGAPEVILRAVVVVDAGFAVLEGFRCAELCYHIGRR